MTRVGLVSTLAMISVLAVAAVVLVQVAASHLGAGERLRRLLGPVRRVVERSRSRMITR